MKVLKDILYGVSIVRVVGSTSVTINAIQYDSRLIEEADLFVAYKGGQSDGHDYIEKVIQSGAKAVLCESIPNKLTEGVTYIQVDNAQKALAVVASNYYEQPSSKLVLVGVTGTNGKTTIASLLFALFKALGYKVGLLSTVAVKMQDTVYPATHTTPDPLQINKYLSQMLAQGVTHCFMEVSSHGISQFRVESLVFSGGVFTNLTHDHLDYHPSFSEYRDVKKRFFDLLPKTAFALTNVDDKNGMYMLQNTKAKIHTYSQKNIADYKVKVLENRFSGMLLSIMQQEVWVRLIGRFNASNLLAVYGVSALLEVEPLDILRAMSALDNVSGRFQYFNANGLTVVVDYAHTPDALENVLKTITEIRTGNEKVYTIIGCGGDRDVDKRPKMAAIASSYSGQVVLTSDNPRSEDPMQIIAQMEAGVSPAHVAKTLSIVDRKQAIKTALTMAQSGDIILIAGKGHEDYQEINGVKYPFDDYALSKELLKDLEKQ